MVAPGRAALALGQVWHRRNRPSEHEFRYSVNQIWIDPDHPEELFDRHRLWSSHGPRPIRFRRRDYFDGTDEPIGPAVRAKLADTLGREPAGPVRMLSQPRTWGWLFNPITVYLAWDSPDDGDPAGAVLEVTNTPWKERLTYPMALVPDGRWLTARFDKVLHVSPFLDERQTYRLALRDGDNPGDLEMSIDVHPTDDVDLRRPVVETGVQLALTRPTTRAMTAALYRNPFPTHRVSLGIHLQAARLARKRVPFVPHPEKRP